MEHAAFELLYKELRRLTEQKKRAGEEIPDILRELAFRIRRIPDRTYTTEQVERMIKLVITKPVRRMGETTYWIHWESGVIDCAGKDLDKVKELAEKQSRESGMSYFIT